MKVSPKYKRFKHSHFTGDTFTLPDVRSSIIHNLQRCIYYQNMPNLGRFGNQTQNIEIRAQKTDRIITVYDRAIQPIQHTDTVIISGHISRPNVSTSHGLIPNYLIVFYGLILDHPHNYIHNYLITSHVQVFKKSNLYPIIEMEEHFLVYYSYATKYYNLTSMLITGYQCSNIYIDVEKWALMNKYIQ